MNLDAKKWSVFTLGGLIDDIYKAKAHKKVELSVSEEKKEGFIPFVSRTEENNGVDCYVRREELLSVEQGNAIVIGDTTSTIFYQPEPFGTGDHIVVIRADWLNLYTGLFIVSVLRKERFRYSYGRAYTMDLIKNTKLKLPADNRGTPDWNKIEAYMKSLYREPLKTMETGENLPELKAGEWKIFYLHRIFDVGMGNGIDAVETTKEDPRINYVSRGSGNNGVVGMVDEIKGEEPFPAGTLTLALGGSLGVCFLQKEPFYTAQNVGVLQEKIPMSDYVKLFIATIIKKECKTRFQPFGRELNAHFRKDFTLKLPVKRNENGIVRDKTGKFSDAGYIPDWQWMENYMRRMPYSDRI